MVLICVLDEVFVPGSIRSFVVLAPVLSVTIVCNIICLLGCTPPEHASDLVTFQLVISLRLKISWGHIYRLGSLLIKSRELGYQRHDPWVLWTGYQILMYRFHVQICIARRKAQHLIWDISISSSLRINTVLDYFCVWIDISIWSRKKWIRSVSIDRLIYWPLISNNFLTFLDHVQYYINMVTVRVKLGSFNLLVECFNSNNDTVINAIKQQCDQARSIILFVARFIIEENELSCCSLDKLSESFRGRLCWINSTTTFKFTQLYSIKSTHRPWHS